MYEPLPLTHLPFEATSLGWREKSESLESKRASDGLSSARLAIKARAVHAGLGRAGAMEEVPNAVPRRRTTEPRSAGCSPRKRKAMGADCVGDSRHLSHSRHLRGLALEAPSREGRHMVQTTRSLSFNPQRLRTLDLRTRPIFTHEDIFALEDDPSPSTPRAPSPASPLRSLPQWSASPSSLRPFSSDAPSPLSTPTPPDPSTRRHALLSHPPRGEGWRNDISSLGARAITIASPEGMRGSPMLAARWFVEGDDPLDSLLGMRNGYRAF